MSAGPIFSSSIYYGDTSGNTFPNYYVGGGGNASPADEGIGVAASLSADSTVQLRFAIPPSVPTGTMKLRLLALANATAGSAYFNIADKNVAAGSSPSAATLTSENSGNSYTVTWSSSAGTTVDDYIETKVPLSPTPSGNDMLVVALTFKHTQVGGGAGTWGLAAVSTWVVSLIWE